MKRITSEWIDKAEGDFSTMMRESRVRKNPNYDAVCFHAQQCAEKYLKARLCEAGVSFGKIHDLVVLLDKVLIVEPLWESFRETLAYISGYAVSFRYPGENADSEAALDARQRCLVFRGSARVSLINEQ
jgi:HEPN domain-containing protein